MIVLVGENVYERDEALAEITQRSDAVLERVDGSELTKADFIDRVAGGSLFAEKRMVVIRSLSDTSELWQALPDLLPRVSDDVQVVLVEDSIDKRTVVWKVLKKIADVREFAAWKDYDTQKAEQWLQQQAGRRDVKLTLSQVQAIVARTGPVQWRLADALEKLALLDHVSDEAIAAMVPQQPLASAFTLLKTALSGDAAALHTQLTELAMTNDPYQLMGLLASQATQILAMVLATHEADVAKDLGVSPFVLRELRPLAKGMSGQQAGDMVRVLLAADAAMKQGGVEPWQALETALVKIAI